MVECAQHFYKLLVTGSLKLGPKGDSLPKHALQNTGLLGHSVGAGLATYMARQADETHHVPFKAVMYLAPAANAVEEQYSPDTVLQGWPPATVTTQLGVQYGLQDTLVRPSQVDDFTGKLNVAFSKADIRASVVRSMHGILPQQSSRISVLTHLSCTCRHHMQEELTWAFRTSCLFALNVRCSLVFWA